MARRRSCAVFEKPVRLVAGGARRQDSVARAFEAIDPPADVIVIHDAARPFVDAATIDRTDRRGDRVGRRHRGTALARYGEAGARRCERRACGGHHPARTRVAGADAPGVHARGARRRPVARGAGWQRHGRSRARGTGGPHGPARCGRCRATSRSRRPRISQLARAALAGDAGVKQRRMTVRIGIGYDSHRLVQGRPLILGGVSIPHATGLSGHSDADALCHAITDAVLGAAALGDIGRHFPGHRPAVEGCRQPRAAAAARSRSCERPALRSSNVDAVVVADQPKLAPHADAIRARLADALGVAAGA